MNTLSVIGSRFPKPHTLACRAVCIVALAAAPVVFADGVQASDSGTGRPRSALRQEEERLKRGAGSTSGDSANPGQQTVRLGHPVGEDALHQRLRSDFQSQFPQLGVDLVPSDADEAVDQILQDELDLAAIARPLTEAEIDRGLGSYPVSDDLRYVFKRPYPDAAARIFLDFAAEAPDSDTEGSDASAGNGSTDNASNGDASPRNASVGNIANGSRPAGNASAGSTSRDNTSGASPSGNASTGNAPMGSAGTNSSSSSAGSSTPAQSGQPPVAAIGSGSSPDLAPGSAPNSAADSLGGNGQPPSSNGATGGETGEEPAVDPEESATENVASPTDTETGSTLDSASDSETSSATESSSDSPDSASSGEPDEASGDIALLPSNGAPDAENRTFPWWLLLLPLVAGIPLLLWVLRGRHQPSEQALAGINRGSAAPPASPPSPAMPSEAPPSEPDPAPQNLTPPSPDPWGNQGAADPAPPRAAGADTLAAPQPFAPEFVGDRTPSADSTSSQPATPEPDSAFPDEAAAQVNGKSAHSDVPFGAGAVAAAGLAATQLDSEPIVPQSEPPEAEPLQTPELSDPEPVAETAESETSERPDTTVLGAVDSGTGAGSEAPEAVAVADSNGAGLPANLDSGNADEIASDEADAIAGKPGSVEAAAVNPSGADVATGLGNGNADAIASSKNADAIASGGIEADAAEETLAEVVPTEADSSDSWIAPGAAIGAAALATAAGLDAAEKTPEPAEEPADEEPVTSAPASQAVPETDSVTGTPPTDSDAAAEAEEEGGEAAMDSETVIAPESIVNLSEPPADPTPADTETPEADATPTVPTADHPEDSSEESSAEPVSEMAAADIQESPNGISAGSETADAEDVEPAIAPVLGLAGAAAGLTAAAQAASEDDAPEPQSALGTPPDVPSDSPPEPDAQSESPESEPEIQPDMEQPQAELETPVIDSHPPEPLDSDGSPSQVDAPLPSDHHSKLEREDESVSGNLDPDETLSTLPSPEADKVAAGPDDGVIDSDSPESGGAEANRDAVEPDSEDEASERAAPEVNGDSEQWTVETVPMGVKGAIATSLAAAVANVGSSEESSEQPTHVSDDSEDDLLAYREEYRRSLTLTSQASRYLLDRKRLEALHTTANATELDPGTYVILLDETSLATASGEYFEATPSLFLWIHGGRVVNQATQAEVDSTWLVLNGASQVVTLEVLERTTVAAFFFNTQLDQQARKINLLILEDEG